MPQGLVMNSKTLHRLCGIDNYRVIPVDANWIKVVMKFVGEESYILGTKHCEVSMASSDGGFGLRFKEPIRFKADQLLGKHNHKGRLVDVLLEFPEHTQLPELSLASVAKGVYPYVLRKQEMVIIS